MEKSLKHGGRTLYGKSSIRSTARRPTTPPPTTNGAGAGGGGGGGDGRTDERR